MSIHERYTKEIVDELNYVATWLPTVRLAPGDVCDMHGHELRVVSHLSEFDVDFELEDRPVESDMEYSSSGAVTMHLKAGGEPPPTGSALSVDEAGVSLSFGRTGAVVLRLADCSAKRIRSLHDVGKQVLRLHEAGEWPEGYVVVTETVVAGASTIIISSGSDAGVDLVAKGSVGPAGLSLASLDAGFQVKREREIGAKFVSMPGLTPLVRVSGVKKRFLRDDVFRSAAEAEEVAFGAVGYDDFSGDE